MANTCISVDGVGCPKGHQGLMAETTHKLVLVKQTDSAVPGELWVFHRVECHANGLLLGHRKAKPPFKHT